MLPDGGFERGQTLAKLALHALCRPGHAVHHRQLLEEVTGHPLTWTSLAQHWLLLSAARLGMRATGMKTAP